MRKNAKRFYFSYILAATCTWFALNSNWQDDMTANIYITEGRRYPPMLYPQVRNVRNTSNQSTWYAISAYMDMRPQAYGTNPYIAILLAGPYIDVEAGVEWHARVFLLRSGAVIDSIACEKAMFSDIDVWGGHSAPSIVNCPTNGSWSRIENISAELGVCLIRKNDEHCDVKAIVPIGLPPRYPEPYFAADQTTEYLAGEGSIAVCVPGVIGDMYAKTVRFFMSYYGRLGVDAVYMYMHSPGHKFATEVESIHAQQKLGLLSDLPQLTIVPWCMQLGASYHCNAEHPGIPFDGFKDLAGQNYGQVLAHQDCLYRAMGVHRWVLFVDLDEFILPRSPTLRNLPQVIADVIKGNKNIAPGEIGFRSAFYENCMPSRFGNVTVSFTHRIRKGRISSMPRPAWSPARVSELYQVDRRTKYLCDPLACDRPGIHYAISQICERFESYAKRSQWPSSCAKVAVHPTTAISHHVRVKDRNGTESAVACHLVPGVEEIDWGITNFVLEEGLA